MPARSKKPPSPFVGLWHIVSMEGCDDDYLSAEVQAFIEFDEKGTGKFQFGYVEGEIDWRPATRGDEPAVEWSWEGADDGHPQSGRGWAIMNADELHGMIFMHMGDESGFVARRAKSKQQRPKRK